MDHRVCQITDVYMTPKGALSLDQKNWGCPRKRKAREETLVFLYRRLFRRKSLPKQQQYWTMCGQCATGGKLIAGCEFDHVTGEGLVTPAQFHGVEISPEIHGENSYLTRGHFHLGDFYRTMATHPGFSPGIVNLDTIMFPERAASYAADVLSLLSNYQNPIMLVVNVILDQEFYNRHSTKQEFPDALQKEAGYEFSLRKARWEMLPRCYRYGGTARSSTQMGSYILIKR